MSLVRALCSGTDLSQQPQQEAKKSRFSLNFLRASLLSPKGSTAPKGSSIFSTTADRKASSQSAASATHATRPQSTSSSPSRHDSEDQSAASAQHWSPLGHGASAFSGSQALPEDQAEDSPSLQGEDTSDSLPDHRNSAESRSPLRALSSNSPTRLRHQSKQDAGVAASTKSNAPPMRSARSALGQSHQDTNDNEDDFAPTMVLGAGPLHQPSPMPPNALVAYSSDDDDWHNAVDATESERPTMHALNTLHHKAHMAADPTCCLANRKHDLLEAQCHQPIKSLADCDAN